MRRTPSHHAAAAHAFAALLAISAGSLLLSPASALFAPDAREKTDLSDTPSNGARAGEACGPGGDDARQSATEYAEADPPSIEWSMTYGGESDDGILATAASPDGGFAAAGYSSSATGDAESNLGHSDGWLLKIASNGKLLAKGSIGGSGRDRIGAISMAADGGYLVAGDTESSDGAFRDSPGTGRARLWAARLTPDFAVSWLRVFEAAGDWTAEAVSETAGGALVIGAGMPAPDERRQDDARRPGGYDPGGDIGLPGCRSLGGER
ncbi:MAG: hypothetical protein LBQ12_08680, partial [Deltaproteobacteria bacterium]|nr:hypothetical protein [Deltaproteobacteria bacterium]